MTPVAFRILKKVARRGELSLSSAIQFAKKSGGGDHIDQYRLALLIEEEYVGMTLDHRPPTGAEQMREFSLAMTLHMFTLPKDSSGTVHYLGIKSHGNVNPEQERVFLKAKGALYLDQYAQKHWDRVWSFASGFMGGVLAALLTALLKRQFSLP
jgi:hypothetical protein